jgi:hypothetical protein
MKASEERTTGVAKASVPNKKKELYEKRRIAVSLSGVGLMRVGAGKPGLLYTETMSHSLTCFHIWVMPCILRGWALRFNTGQVISHMARKDKRAQLITGSYSCHSKNGNESVIVPTERLSSLSGVVSST